MYITTNISVILFQEYLKVLVCKDALFQRTNVKRFK